MFFPVPDAPTNLQGEATSPNSIRLTWDIPETTVQSADAVVESYELYYNDSHQRQNVHVTVTPARTTYLLEDLTPNTVYHVRVAARSARGEGESTATIQVRTLEYGKKNSSGSPLLFFQSSSFPQLCNFVVYHRRILHVNYCV